MRILAFDTATVACSAAVWEDGAIRARRFERMPRGQAEALLPMIRATLADAGLGFADFDRLAVTIGPGAFTGLRIGLSAARALALAAGLPVVGVTTTEAIARAVPEDERRDATLLVVLDSKRADLYAQAFDADLRALGEPLAVAPDRVADLAAEGPLVLAGDAAERLLPSLAARGRNVRLAAAPGDPDAAFIAALAAGRPPVEHPSPLYLRPADATLPADGGRLRP